MKQSVFRAVLFGLLIGVGLYIVAVASKIGKKFLKGPGIDTKHLASIPELYENASRLRTASMGQRKTYQDWIKRLDQYVKSGCTDEDLFYELKKYVVELQPNVLKKNKLPLFQRLILSKMVKNPLRNRKETFLTSLANTFRGKVATSSAVTSVGFHKKDDHDNQQSNEND